MVRLEDRFQKDPAVVLRKIGDDFFLFPVRSHQDLEYIYTLQGSGARIWELLDGRHDTAAILKLLSDECRMKPEDVEKDLLGFIGELKKEALIRHG